MRDLCRWAAATACAVAATLITLDACTTFSVRSGNAVVFGRNYDFDFGRGLLVVNPAGLEKRGFEDGGPIWTARHGSVTLNQFGREFPMGGMNDVGLVVELMWHDRAEYPARDRRAPLGVLQWIQYQLDTAATADDVVKSDSAVRISGGVPLHYLVADRAGRAAVVEFASGRLVAHTGDALPVAALANDTYEDALAFWRRQEGRRASGSASNARFARAADALQSFDRQPGANAVDRAFAILAGVAQRSTRWSIVYDQMAGTIWFRTEANPAIRQLTVTREDFPCARGARIVDVNARLSGDIRPSLEPYSESRNRALVEASYREFSGTRGTGRDAIERVVAYPGLAHCVAGATAAR